MIEKSKKYFTIFLTSFFLIKIICGTQADYSTATREEIIEILKTSKFTNLSNISEIHGPFSAEEYKEMHDETNVIGSLLADSIKSERGDKKNVLKSQIEAFKLGNHTDSFICKTCLWTFSKYHNLLEKKYGLTLFNQLLSLFCSIGLDYKICKEAIDLYSPTVIDSLIEHYLDAEYICTKTKICKFSHFNELDPDNYAKELLKDKPAKKLEQVDPSGHSLKVLHVTDIHTDLLYEEVN
jgi:hypothetical protein